MSVLIKGMEMPKEGNWKTICIYSDGSCDRENWQGDCTLIKGAQAVEIPPHGRLIDADVVIDRINMNIDLYGADFPISQAMMRNFIERAPTFMDAEER